MCHPRTLRFKNRSGQEKRSLSLPKQAIISIAQRVARLSESCLLIATRLGEAYHSQPSTLLSPQPHVRDFVTKRSPSRSRKTGKEELSQRLGPRLCRSVTKCRGKTSDAVAKHPAKATQPCTRPTIQTNHTI